MSRSKCPYPNQFDLLYTYRQYRFGAYSSQLREVVAVKDNGWYTVYDKEDMGLPHWRRRCYASAMRWYDLERKIEQGIFTTCDTEEQETAIDIADLI